MNKEDIPFLSVAELSAQIKNRSVSPMEATQAYLDRIDSLDFKFNPTSPLLETRHWKRRKRQSKPSPMATIWGRCTEFPLR